MAKNIEMSVLGSDGSYEVLYPASVSNMIQLSQEMLTNLGLSSGTLDSALIATVIPSMVPVGCMFWYCNQNPPVGFLICDGSAISRTNYSQLFAVIGTTFGGGDGSTTFALPNLLAKFVRGAGSSGGYSTSFGVTREATSLATYLSERSSALYFPVIGNPDKSNSYGSTNRYNTYEYMGNNSGHYNYYFRPYNIALTPIIKY